MTPIRPPDCPFWMRYARCRPASERPWSVASTRGLDVQETAEALGCSPGTVKSQTARGLSALRAALGDAIDVETALEVQS